MPTLEKTERVSSFHQKLTFTLVDLNLLDPNLKFSAPIDDSILKGTWSLAVAHSEEKGLHGVKILCYWSQVRVGALGENIDISTKFGALTATDEVVYISNGRWATYSLFPDSQHKGIQVSVSNAELEANAASSGGTFDPKTQRRYILELDLRSTAYSDPVERALTQSGFYRHFFAYFDQTDGLLNRPSSLAAPE